MNYYDNTTFVFLPFRIDKDNLNILNKRLSSDAEWLGIKDRNKYLLKYVAEKLEDGENIQETQYIHYMFNLSKNKLEEVFYIEGKYNRQNVKFKFMIKDIHLYCFDTGIGIIALKIIFDNADPTWIANAQYYLKKVSTENYFYDEKKNAYSFIGMIKILCKNVFKSINIEFFYYLNSGTEKANILTYLEINSNVDLNKILYYLKHVYNESFLYDFETEDAQDIFKVASDTTWGISSEAAVCLKCPELGSEDFIQTKFYENFCTQYLFMYVYLLHQKYVLYSFLSSLKDERYNDLDKLEMYRSRLYEFESKYVFTVISEIPQYQMLYEKIHESFSLRKLYEDVHEPLVSLSELRRSEKEKSQKQRDESINSALILLSLLSLFSALIDSFDFAKSFFKQTLRCSNNTVFVIQLGCIVISIGIVIYVFVRILKSQNRK